MTSIASARRGSQRLLGVGPRERVVLGIVMVGAAATVAVGLALGRARLGTATPPFVADWAPALHPLAATAVVALGAGCALVPHLQRLRPPSFTAAVFALSLTLGLALNTARYGTPGWSAVFDVQRGGEAVNEYLPGRPALSYGAHFYLDRFAELVPSQPVNVAGHPPGPLLLVHALGIDGARGLAALCIGVGSTTAPLTYALARRLHSDRTARTAAILVAFSPAVLLDGVTSFDYVFAALGTAAALLLLTRPLAGAAALAVASLFSWALPAVAVWAAIVARRPLTLVMCGVAILALNGALAAATGYDPAGTLRATSAVYDESIASMRPYAFWVAGSVVAWGVMLGPPIAAGAIRNAVRGDRAALALAAVIGVAAVGGYTKAETERIWLFLVPLACVAAAPRVRPTRAAPLLAAQALAIQTLFATVW